MCITGEGWDGQCLLYSVYNREGGGMGVGGQCLLYSVYNRGWEGVAATVYYTLCI